MHYNLHHHYCNLFIYKLTTEVNIIVLFYCAQVKDFNLKNQNNDFLCPYKSLKLIHLSLFPWWPMIKFNVFYNKPFDVQHNNWNTWHLKNFQPSIQTSIPSRAFHNTRTLSRVFNYQNLHQRHDLHRSSLRMLTTKLK